jgi:hypothetical protein
VKGAETKAGKAQLSSALDRISERITLAFETLSRSEAKNWNFPYISIGYGGEGGIRTPDRLAPMPHFECGAFDHSATSPGAMTGQNLPFGRAEF